MSDRLMGSYPGELGPQNHVQLLCRWFLCLLQNTSEPPRLLRHKPGYLQSFGDLEAPALTLLDYSLRRAPRLHCRQYPEEMKPRDATLYTGAVGVDVVSYVQAGRCPEDPVRYLDSCFLYSGLHLGEKVAEP